ncbi:MAG: hypothetical protein Q4Q58_04330 [Thermoplasmata archaeon]|nr:hypothetical protein [Thermoplasmata archaeon]
MPSLPVQWFRWRSVHPWASNCSAYASATGFFLFSSRTAPTNLWASRPNLDLTASRAGSGPDAPLPLTIVSFLPSIASIDSERPSVSICGESQTFGMTSVHPPMSTISAFALSSSERPMLPGMNPRLPE